MLSGASAAVTHAVGVGPCSTPRLRMSLITASLILRIDGRFVTPAPNGGILHGTTQLSLFAHLAEHGHEIAYEIVPVAALTEADAAWLVSSVRLAVPITAVDGREVPVDAELTASFNRYLLSPRD